MHYLTFVRHGETPCNVAGIVQSRTGGELTEKGTDMARCVGVHLKNEEFTRIYSSDLQRCRETTKGIISELATNVPEVQYTVELRERDYGDWEFLDVEVVREKMREMGLLMYENYKVDVPNGETRPQVQARAAKFFSEICKQVDEAAEDEHVNILVVSHGIFKMNFLEHLVTNSELYEIQNFHEDQMKARPPNSARTRFSIGKVNGDGKRIITFTHFLDAEHLKYLSVN